MRLMLTILAEVVIDALTGKLERPYRADKLRGDSRLWGAFVRAKRPDVTPVVVPTAPQSGRR